MDGKLTITIELGNAAFQPDPWPEIAYILGECVELSEGMLPVADSTNGNTSALLRDHNGNTVGRMKIDANCGDENSGKMRRTHEDK